jgi:hypothetical protein
MEHQAEFTNEWILARLAEQKSLEEHGVLELVHISTIGKSRVWGSREILMIKMNPPDLENPAGSIEKFKYRVVVQALSKLMKEGIDYVEKYASTVRWESQKVLVAIAVMFDLEIHLYDISTFFLYGQLKELVYMKQPKSWVTETAPANEWVYKLHRSLYGLPQAPHYAQIELKETLTSTGEMLPTASDDCIYSATNIATGYIAMAAHVDDLMAVGSQKGMQKVEDALKTKFKYTKKVSPSVMMGVQVERNREMRWLKLHQTDYVDKLLEKHSMTDCKPADTPLNPGMAKALMMLPVDKDKHDANATHQFQTIVGELVWLSIRTRPELRFLISLLSRFLQSATDAHVQVARDRPLRYLKGTRSDGLVFFPGAGKFRATGSADSDLAGDLNSSRSTLGWYGKLGDFGAVIVHCGLDRKISTATGQAETYAMLGLVKTIVWLRILLAELHFEMDEPTELRTDNDGVLKQNTKSINHTTTKHYRIAQAYIREKVRDMM